MAGSDIPSGCFIVADIPDDVGREILRIRSRFRDPYDTTLPVEITLAGSSGVGVMVSGQASEPVFAALDQIAASTLPFETSFGSTKRFPNTDIFVLTIADPEPFQALHRRIAASGIRFEASPHVYEPHCTLCRRSPISEGDAAALMATAIPGTFRIDALAIYRAIPLPATPLYRVPLGGGCASSLT